MVYDLASHPEAQHKLREELLALERPLQFPFPTDNVQLPTPKELETLPLLNACIKESLRLRGTLPVPFPRVTPYNKHTTIGGYDKIPGGVRVTSFAWCLHRNQEVFPDPEDWRPERWLGARSDRLEQEKWLWPFASGSRMCLGNNLALESMLCARPSYQTKIEEN